MSESSQQKVNPETLKLWVDAYRKAIAIRDGRRRQIAAQLVIEKAGQQGIEAWRLLGSI